MIDQQLKLLARLANSDGTIDDKERSLIQSLGVANGLEEEEVTRIIEEPQGDIDYESLTPEERFDYLYNLVHLMKIDGEVFNQEVEYCESIAKKLGYQLAAIYEIFPHVHPRVKIPDEIRRLRKVANKYLKRDNG